MSKLGLSEIAPLAESIPLWRTALDMRQRARLAKASTVIPVGDEFARTRSRRREWSEWDMRTRAQLDRENEAAKARRRA